MKKRKLAVFDIDGTIFRSSLLIELVHALIEEGVFKPSVEKLYERDYERWRDRKGSYEVYINNVVAAFMKNLKGVRQKDFMRIAENTVMAHKDHVYRFTRDLVRALKRKNYYLVAVSHSPKSIVDFFARQAGFDKSYGILYEIDERTGRFNGNMLHKDLVLDKAKIFRRILEKEAVTLRGSVGVGDTDSDIAFLELVRTPICFNPNKKLYDAARRRGWRVVVERKDVVYQIRNAV